MKACEYLVVDSVGFLRNAPLAELADHVISLAEVVAEIKDAGARMRLQALPVPVEFKEPDCDDIKQVTDFSRLTGDYPSLSATDIKVLATTLMLEKRHVGTEHLRSEPICKPTVNFGRPKETPLGKLAGFYKPSGEENDDDAEEEVNDSEQIATEKEDEKVVSDLIGVLNVSKPDEDTEDLGQNEEEEEEEVDDEEEEEDDDEGWITPMNIKEKKRLMNSELEEEEQKTVKVACLTTDFAMQNVLRQMGLNVISMDGLLIKETKTWILRCYACFRTTSIMDTKFCPKCGNRTLKRVSVTQNSDGTQQIHISTRRRLTGRGKRFSLPAPKGGKHAVNPVLCADQHLPQQRQTRLAKKKTDAMNPDYLAGNSPFAHHDVTSKSAIIGVPGKGHLGNLYWMRKNPNEARKKTGNRKKNNVV